MKKISMKKVLLIVAIALLIATISSVSLAGVIARPGDIVPDQTDASNAVQGISGQILGIIQVIAVAVAVIMLVILAIKYLSAAPGEKADIKKSAFTYVIGALLLFGGVALLNVIQSFGEELNDTTSTGSWI